MTPDVDTYHSFEAALTPMPWGDKVYTVLPLPQAVSDRLAAEGARRVEGEIAECPVNLALTRAPVIDAVFVYTGKSLLSQIGCTPGDVVEVRLRKADADLVEVPQDLAGALRSAAATRAWETLSPGKRRAELAHIDGAKRSATRQNRIAQLVATLDGDASATGTNAGPDPRQKIALSSAAETRR